MEIQKKKIFRNLHVMLLHIINQLSVSNDSISLLNNKPSTKMKRKSHAKGKQLHVGLANVDWDQWRDYDKAVDDGTL